VIQIPWTAPKTWSVAEVVTAANMNAHVRDNLNYLNAQHKAKAADQTLTTTTLTNDSDLFFATAINEIWLVDTYILVDSNATADIKYTWTVPSGTMKWAPLSQVAGVEVFWHITTGSSSTALKNATDVMVSESLAATNIWGVNMKSIVVAGGTAGNVQFQWAQNVASGSTILKAGSLLIATRVST
jgi:hypothetical protein